MKLWLGLISSISAVAAVICWLIGNGNGSKHAKISAVVFGFLWGSILCFGMGSSDFWSIVGGGIASTLFIFVVMWLPAYRRRTARRQLEEFRTTKRRWRGRNK